LSSDDFDTLSTVYEIYLSLKFTALQQCVAIIYFRSQVRLEETRRYGKMFRDSTNDNLHVVYLLLDEHKDWTFGALEWRGEDFWEKVRTKFEYGDDVV
jgi:UDP-galactopyranose mutase